MLWAFPLLPGLVSGPSRERRIFTGRGDGVVTRHASMRRGRPNKWIRQMEAPNKLNVLKMSGEYRRNMESPAIIQFGFPVFARGRRSSTRTLEPLLLKQIFKQGGVPAYD